MYTVEVQCRVGSPVIDDDWCGCVVHMRTTCLMSELMISEQWRTDGCIRGGVWIHSSICDAHVQFYQLHFNSAHRILSSLQLISYRVLFIYVTHHTTGWIHRVQTPSTQTLHLTTSHPCHPNVLPSRPGNGTLHVSCGGGG